MRHGASEHSKAACRPKGGAPLIKGHLPSTGQDSHSSGPAHTPTWVDLQVVPGITEINEQDNSFQITGFMTLVWCDPRLEDGASAADRVFLDEQADEKLGEIWWPDLMFVNGRAAVNTQTQTLRIDSRGTVKYERRFDVLLEADYDFRLFPFDRQTLTVEIESFTWPETDLMLLQEPVTSVNINVPQEWVLKDTTYMIKNEAAELAARYDRAAAAFKSGRGGDKGELDALKAGLASLEARGPTFSNFTMSLGVARRPGFYFAKLIVPLVLIVGISWAVFWAKPDDLNDRIALTVTAILTIVAFQFLISDQLPRVSYQTFMDRLLLTSFGFMIMTGLESVVVNMLVDNGRGSVATAVDRKSRWAFPLGYVTLLGLISAATFWP